MIKKLRNQIWQEIISAIILQTVVPAIILLGIRATGWRPLLAIAIWQAVIVITMVKKLKPIVLSYYEEKRRIELFPLTEDLNKQVDQLTKKANNLVGQKDIPTQKQGFQDAYEAYKGDKGQCLKL